MSIETIMKSADETASAADAKAVTPSDVAVLPDGPALALFIGGTGGGTLTIITAKNSTIQFTGLAAGSLLPVRAKQVLSTGTTVTNIVALY